eukprot:11546488-Alexandrium_andersonii.AAC.1
MCIRDRAREAKVGSSRVPGAGQPVASIPAASSSSSSALAQSRQVATGAPGAGQPASSLSAAASAVDPAQAVAPRERECAA